MADILSITKITSLALVNSVNPCQIAMLILVLVAIFTQNQQDNKRKILFSGLAFILAVFLGYLFYGIVLVQLFQTFAATLRTSSIYLNYALAILAMIIGALQIKDYFMYKPGNVGTEMPLYLRPRAKLWINKITSPGGAFLIGLVITLFLAPCTMAPLLVVTEAISTFGIIGALPWLLYFNFIVVLPLIIITLIVYKGFTTIENITEWRERNIKKLHLIAGILLFGTGLIILLL
jgi:cytochrome c biogenesis protein CcdA